MVLGPATDLPKWGPGSPKRAAVPCFPKGIRCKKTCSPPEIVPTLPPNRTRPGLSGKAPPCGCQRSTALEHSANFSKSQAKANISESKKDTRGSSALAARAEAIETPATDRGRSSARYRTIQDPADFPPPHACGTKISSGMPKCCYCESPKQFKEAFGPDKRESCSFLCKRMSLRSQRNHKVAFVKKLSLESVPQLDMQTRINMPYAQ